MISNHFYDTCKKFMNSIFDEMLFFQFFDFYKAISIPISMKITLRITPSKLI